MPQLRMMQLCGLDYGFHMHLMPVVRAFTDAGFDVVCCGPRGSFHREIVGRGQRYIEVPFSRDMNLWNHWTCLRALRNVLRRERIDILHSHSLIGGLLGRIAARDAGVPLSIYTAHGFRFHPDQNPLAYRFYLEMERIGARYTDYLFTQNREDRDAAIRLRLVPRERVHAIGNGIELRRFDRGHVSRDAITRLRRELRIPDGATVITAIGRPTVEKGAADFVEMARAVSETGRNAIFIAVFPAIENERHSIRTTLLRRSAPANLRILDYRRDIPELLALTDIYVLASQYEGLSRSLMEAMASGAAPVVSDVRGTREMVRHGETGYLLPVGDVAAFTRHLIALVDDPARRAELGRQARALAIDNFDETAMLSDQVRVICRLARERFGARADTTSSQVA
jgi:glycosyltransferase involved in cell wall biosynthesis